MRNYIQDPTIYNLIEKCKSICLSQMGKAALSHLNQEEIEEIDRAVVLLGTLQSLRWHIKNKEENKSWADHVARQLLKSNREKQKAIL